MQNGEGASPGPVDLSEKDREMLERHSRDLHERAGKSIGWQEKEEPEKEWVVETLPIHRAKNIGSPGNVKHGDETNMVGQGTRRDSHPIGNEKRQFKQG